MSRFVTARLGESPLVISFPHTGTDIPPDIDERLADADLSRYDTDWHVHELYEPLVSTFRATVVRTTISRTVVDVNRDPSGASLYPGQATTDLCPLTTFDGTPLYRPGREPDVDEIDRRTNLYFRPYHAALANVIGATRRRHGWCLLYDCHSIRSIVPRLFDGELPDFNIGTNSGAACAPDIRDAALEAATRSPYSAVADQRFKGGWITRHFGRPAEHVHAIQMELAQHTYLWAEEPPWTFDHRRARRARHWLTEIVRAALQAGKDLEETS